MSGPRYDLVPPVGAKSAPPPEASNGDYVPDTRFFRNNPLLCFFGALVTTWVLLRLL